MLSNSGASVSRPSTAHAQLVHLARRRRGLAERAGGDLHVLVAQRVGHVVGRDGAPASRDGSSHSRIEYLRSPKIVTSLTPGMRLSASFT